VIDLRDLEWDSKVTSKDVPKSYALCNYTFVSCKKKKVMEQFILLGFVIACVSVVAYSIGFYRGGRYILRKIQK